MPQYLVAIHHPDNYDPSTEDEAMVRDIDVLNEEMAAAGARFFAGGLQAATRAKSLRKQPGGKVLVTDGPYLETKEHIGGFWILDAANMDEAVAWGRKAVVACRASVEVREFLTMPTEEKLQPQNTETQMRKLRIMEHISLDVVIQHSADDGDFPYIDWTAPYRTPA